MEIKILAEDDWELFRDIRLEALKNSPINFGSSYDQEAIYDETQFRQILNDNYIFGAFIEGKIIASAAIASNTKPRRIHIGEIWAVYTKPDYRNQSVSQRLLSRLIEFAKNHFMQLKLSVNTENSYALQAYKKVGFKEYGQEPRALKIDNNFEDITLMVLMLDS